MRNAYDRGQPSRSAPTLPGPEHDTQIVDGRLSIPSVRR
jgi:hypothetical protein